MTHSADEIVGGGLGQRQRVASLDEVVDPINAVPLKEPSVGTDSLLPDRSQKRGVGGDLEPSQIEIRSNQFAAYLSASVTVAVGHICRLMSVAVTEHLRRHAAIAFPEHWKARPVETAVDVLGA